MRRHHVEKLKEAAWDVELYEEVKDLKGSPAHRKVKARFESPISRVRGDGALR